MRGSSSACRPPSSDFMPVLRCSHHFVTAPFIFWGWDGSEVEGVTMCKYSLSINISSEALVANYDVIFQSLHIHGQQRKWSEHPWIDLLLEQMSCRDYCCCVSRFSMSFMVGRLVWSARLFRLPGAAHTFRNQGGVFVEDVLSKNGDTHKHI